MLLNFSDNINNWQIIEHIFVIEIASKFCKLSRGSCDQTIFDRQQFQFPFVTNFNKHTFSNQLDRSVHIFVMIFIEYENDKIFIYWANLTIFIVHHYFSYINLSSSFIIIYLLQEITSITMWLLIESFKSYKKTNGWLEVGT